MLNLLFYSILKSNKCFNYFLLTLKCIQLRLLQSDSKGSCKMSNKIDSFLCQKLFPVQNFFENQLEDGAYHNKCGLITIFKQSK